MTTRLPAELRGEALAGTAPAGSGVPPTDPAGATNWPVWCVFAEFAQAVGVQLPTDRRGGKRGERNVQDRLVEPGRPLTT